MVNVSVLVAALALGGGPDGVSEQAQRRMAHQVDQALLYVDMKLPARARERLQQLLAAPHGRTDALAWLALARAFYAERRLDQAGTAVRRAQGFGIKKRLGERKWARTFFRRFQEKVGGIRIWADDCSKFRFSARLAVPIVDRERRALLEGVPGWRKKELVRPANVLFFLPEGQYKLGNTRLQIMAGEDTSVTGEDLEAACEGPANPNLAASQAASPSEIDIVPMTVVTEPSLSSLVSSPWFWVAVGAAVAAGGVTAAVLASQGNGRDEFRLTF